MLTLTCRSHRRRSRSARCPARDPPTLPAFRPLCTGHRPLPRRPTREGGPPAPAGVLGYTRGVGRDLRPDPRSSSRSLAAERGGGGGEATTTRRHDGGAVRCGVVRCGARVHGARTCCLPLLAGACCPWPPPPPPPLPLPVFPRPSVPCRPAPCRPLRRPPARDVLSSSLCACVRARVRAHAGASHGGSTAARQRRLGGDGDGSATAMAWGDGLLWPQGPGSWGWVG